MRAALLILGLLTFAVFSGHATGAEDRSYSGDMAAGAKAFNAGDFAEAESRFKNAISVGDSDLQKAKAWFSAGVAASRLGHIKDAKYDAKSSLLLAPDYAKAQELLKELDATAEQAPADAPAPETKAKAKKTTAARKAAEADANPPDAAATKCPAVDQWARAGTKAEFYGTCGDKVQGIVLWKAKGRAVDISCIIDHHGYLSDLLNQDAVHGLRDDFKDCRDMSRSIPGFCATGDKSNEGNGYAGQCQSGEPNGVGFMKGSADSGDPKHPFITYYAGNFKSGKFNGYGVQFHGQCDVFDCTDDVGTVARDFRGFFADGSFQYACSSEEDCISLPARQAAEAKRKSLQGSIDAATADFKCDAVKTIEEGLGDITLESRPAEGFFIACLKKQRQQMIADAKCEGIGALDAQLGDASGAPACQAEVGRRRIAKQKQDLSAQRSAALKDLNCDAVKTLDAQIGDETQYGVCTSELEKHRQEVAHNQLIEQRKAAISASNCDDVKRLDEQLKDGDNFADCSFTMLLASASARDLFVAAGEYEANNDRGRAKKLYLTILKKYKNDDLAIKAVERIGKISDGEAADSSNANAVSAANAAAQAAQETQATIDQANRDSAQRASQARSDFCRGRDDCNSSCSNLDDDNQRRYCLDQCRAQFSGC